MSKKKNDSDKYIDEEIVFEDDSDDGIRQADIKSKLKDLREKLKKCSEEKAEYLSGWQRAQADMVNLKKAGEEERRKVIQLANLALIEDLLPVLDSFEMAFRNKKTWESVSSDWRSGIEYIHNQLWSALSAKGLAKIEPEEGTPFDPSVHEPAGNISTEDKKEDNMVASLERVGYKIGDRVIRPASVNVYQFK